MNKKNLTSIAILLVLVVLFLITKINNKTEHRINFFDVDSTRIGQIEISTIKDTIRLAKNENEEWVVAYPLQTTADANSVKQLFEKTLKVTTSNLPVSENKDALETYNLTDSLATTVKLLDKNNKELNISLIGKGSSYYNCYGRHQGENKIYRLENNVNYNIKTDLNYWRKKEIVEIPQEDLAKISVSYSHNGYELTTGDSLWQFNNNKETFDIPKSNSTLKSILNSFNKFRASDFVDNNYTAYQEVLKNPQLEIEINLTNGDHTHLRFASIPNKKYIIQLNDQTNQLYKVSEYVAQKFMKTAENFKK